MKFVESLIVAGIITAGTTASPAAANWQFTKWGMTADQVKAASVGKEEYTAGNYAFKVDYVYGDDGGLSRVVLTLKKPIQCEALIADLSVKYGKPVGFERPIPDITKVKWADSANNDTVEVTKLPSDCFLAYSPSPAGL